MVQALSYFAGLHWIAPDLDAGTIVRTVLLMHICDATVCSVIASNHGDDRRLWTALGFVFGIWAVAVMLVRVSLSERR